MFAKTKNANKLFAQIEKRKKIVCKLMRLCNINQGLITMNRVLTTYPGFSPQKPWDERHWAHVEIYIWVTNINLLNTLSVIFVSFWYFLYKIGNWTSTGARHCVSNLSVCAQHFPCLCMHVPSPVLVIIIIII